MLSFMSIHGTYFLTLNSDVTDCPIGLVAMRVHALFGGRFALKVVLWVCWLVYAGFTSFLLGYGLWKGDRE